MVFAIRRDPVAVELEGWFIYFAISESSPSDCMQEKSFFCRIRWVLGQTWRPTICCSGHVSAFYSFLLPTLDVFQWVCDITRLSTIIRCFFQVNRMCLGKRIHTHAHTHTHTPHFTVFLKIKTLICDPHLFGNFSGRSPAQQRVHSFGSCGSLGPSCVRQWEFLHPRVRLIQLAKTFSLISFYFQQW